MCARVGRDPITVGHELPIRTGASLVRSLPRTWARPGASRLSARTVERAYWHTDMVGFYGLDNRPRPTGPLPRGVVGVATVITHPYAEPRTTHVGRPISSASG